MKVLGNTTLAKDVDAKYSFGANIQDETNTVVGTPVVRELYGDIIQNIYRFLELTKVNPTNTEDNKNTQFQFVEAISKFANQINDINHVLSLDGLVWSLPLDLEILPNKFVCFAQVTDSYVNGVSYSFKGIGVDEIPFSSDGFKASEQVLIVIENSIVKAFSLSKLAEVSDTVFTTLGSPISFNDTDKMYYKEDGYLITDLPSSFELENALRVFTSDGTLILQNVFIYENKITAFCLRLENNTYYTFDLLINDLENITQSGIFPNDGDLNFSPYSFLDLNGVLYLTNNGNNNDGIDDFNISKYQRNASGIFQFVSSILIDSDFEKTTNAIVKNDFIYTFVDGYLRKYNLLTGVKTDLMYLPGVNGQLFQFNGEVYFTTGEVAKKWILN